MLRGRAELRRRATAVRHPPNGKPDSAGARCQLAVVGMELIDPVVAPLVDGDCSCQVNGIERANHRREGLAGPGEECPGHADAVYGSPERCEPLMHKYPFGIVQVAAQTKTVNGAVKFDTAYLAGSVGSSMNNSSSMDGTSLATL